MDASDRSQLELLGVKLNAKLDSIAESQRVFQDAYAKDQLAQAKVQDDVEKRLRSVERWKLSIPISVLLAMATVLGALVGVPVGR